MPNNPDDLPGMKEDELIELGPCPICHKPQIAQDATFYVVEVRRAIFDRRSIERRVGLEMMLGSGPLAKVMGPNEDIAKVFDGPHRAFVHESCAHGIVSLMLFCDQPKADSNPGDGS